MSTDGESAGLHIVPPVVGSNAWGSYSQQDFAQPLPLSAVGPIKWLWQRVGWFDNPAMEQGYVDFAFPSSTLYLAIGDLIFGLFPILVFGFLAGTVTDPRRAVEVNGYIAIAIILVPKSIGEFVCSRCGWWQRAVIAERLSFVTASVALAVFSASYSVGRLIDCDAVSLRDAPYANTEACLDAVIPFGYFFNTWAVLFIYRARFCFYRLLLTLAPIIIGPIISAISGPRDRVLHMFIMAVFVCLIAALFAFEEHTTRSQYRQRLIADAALQVTQRATHQLNIILLTLLPDQMLQRMLRGERIADAQAGSVIFVDVANFTKWSSARTAVEVVAMLSDYFARVDALLALHDINKITTIGDAYWASSGIPVANVLHAQNACTFALEVLKAAERVNLRHHTVGVRIGVASGHVYGGIVDREDTSYQLFGAINEEAERLEQEAPVMGVLVNASVKEQCLVPCPERFLFGPSAEGGVDFVLTRAGPEEQQPAPSLSTSVAESVLTKQHSSDRQRFLQVRSCRTDDVSRLREHCSEQRGGCCSDNSFLDEEVETHYQARRRVAYSVRASLTHTVNAARNVLFIVFVLVLLPSDVTWVTGSAITYSILTLLQCLCVAFSDRLHPMVHFFMIAVDANANYAIAVLTPNIGTVAASSVTTPWFQIGMYVQRFFVGPWFLPCFLNVLVNAVPQILWSLRFQPIGPGIISNLLVAGLLTIVPVLVSAAKERALALDEYVTSTAEKRTSEQQEMMTGLLGRSMPSFVVPELRRWIAMGRSGGISHQFSLAGVAFLKRFAPNASSLDDQGSNAGRLDVAQLVAILDQMSEYQVAVMQLIQAAVNRGADIVRVKVLGDVTMLAAGLIYGRRTNPRKRADEPESRLVSLQPQEESSGQQVAATVGLLQLCHAIGSLTLSDGSFTVSGVHAGDAAGGVIGTERLIYDIFGDTVNTAARVMQTSCVSLIQRGTNTQSRVYVTSEALNTVMRQEPSGASAQNGAAEVTNPLQAMVHKPQHIASDSSDTVLQLGDSDLTFTHRGATTTTTITVAPAEGRLAKGKGTLVVHQLRNVNSEAV